jgi:hypothetical protein
MAKPSGTDYALQDSQQEEGVMLTHSEAKRWATIMLKSALCDGMQCDEISRQVHLVCDKHGKECLEELIEEILMEAGRIGPQHSAGGYHHH